MNALIKLATDKKLICLGFALNLHGTIQRVTLHSWLTEPCRRNVQVGYTGWSVIGTNSDLNLG